MKELRFLSILCCIFLSACESTAYYSQAISGQLSILNQRQDLQDVIDDENSSERLKTRLQQVQQIREFAAKDLLLPVGDSYNTYADIHRDYVVWNVYAAGELSLTSKVWCFPVAGCIAYRGYFSQAPAIKKAKKLKSENYDVYVAGVRAYSTLGWFDDPVLNTFINDDALDLVNLLFHELSHRHIYIKGDTAFNESFATAVADIGVQLWLKKYQPQKSDTAYQQYGKRRESSLQFKKMLADFRPKLEQLYANEGLDDDEKREEKQRLFNDLQEDYVLLKKRIGHSRYDNWMATVNNAKLANIANYNRLVPDFLRMYQQLLSLEDFYAQVNRIAELPINERHQALNTWVKPSLPLKNNH